MTSPRHIDDATLKGLLAGEIRGEEARRLADHLEAGCPTCDAARAADGLEGALDDLLLGLAPGAGPPGNDLEWARIQRGLRTRRPARRLGIAAIAAGTLLAVGLTVEVVRRAGPGPDASWDGLKGSESQVVAARLRFSVVPGPGSARPELERGASGAVLPEDASLLFRVETAGPARLALLRLGEDRGSEVVWEGAASRAGSLDVEVGGRPAAFPLRGLRGRQRFALLAAPSLDREQVEAALRLLSAPQARPSPGPAISLDVLEVTIR